MTPASIRLEAGFTTSVAHCTDWYLMARSISRINLLGIEISRGRQRREAGDDLMLSVDYLSEVGRM